MRVAKLNQWIYTWFTDQSYYSVPCFSLFFGHFAYQSYHNIWFSPPISDCIWCVRCTSLSRLKLKSFRSKSEAAAFGVSWRRIDRTLVGPIMSHGAPYKNSPRNYVVFASILSFFCRCSHSFVKIMIVS